MKLTLIASSDKPPPQFFQATLAPSVVPHEGPVGARLTLIKDRAESNRILMVADSHWRPRAIAAITLLPIVERPILAIVSLEPSTLPAS
ncbi:hypothetical protein [Cyanobium sp. N5-Cardenillas]|uniref:hypothetical protein n=1 Tax=Cyanobium sp. N5-Cardenillas TaxID=2823720 RepID=UPI0020CEA2CC|nr:hypothetical protein [Cyanobium sp. N5-Cardenillas]MCP9784688.1 hypothetical protein [Cyanobium sp. N5-Cardenillas]